MSDITQVASKDLEVAVETPIEVPKRLIGGLEIMPVTDRPQTLNILFYGKPGVGKTVLAGSASLVEDMQPVLVIDVEGGTPSLQNRFPNIDVVRVSSYVEMQEVYKQLRREKGAGYRTVVLDSLTEIQKVSMNTIMGNVVAENAERDPDIPSVREWGKNIEQTRRLVRLFRDLPVHTIFTSHEMQDKDPKSGLMPTKPSLPGKLSNEVAGFVDIVAYMYTKTINGEIKRLLLTAGTETQIAKDRSDRLPAVMESPTMEDIYTFVFKEPKKPEPETEN